MRSFWLVLTSLESLLSMGLTEPAPIGCSLLSITRLITESDEGREAGSAQRRKRKRAAHLCSLDSSLAPPPPTARADEDAAFEPGGLGV